ncbi:MAG TPA: hypothetical protein VK956_07275, partial [Verrucomicrobium sp.]|nr:hypothetical protein [Verrucomicrobium sp.]
MKKAFDDYTLLVGGTGGKGSLWQGPDHLLVVEGQGWIVPYGEVYRRIDYDKIQALTLVPTQTHIWASVGFAAGAALFALIAFFTRAEPFILVTVIVPALMFLTLLVVNVARGGTCRCSLQTAVQVLKLKPLVRTRTASRVVREITALCRQHQGDRTLDSLPPSTVSLDKAPDLPDVMPGSKLPWTGNIWTFATGLVLIVWGGVLAGELFVNGVTYTVVNAVLGAASLVMGILALVRTIRYRVPGVVLVSLWSSLFLDLVAGVVMYIIAVVGVMKQTMADSGAAISKSNFQEQQVLTALSDFSLEQSGPWGWGLVALGALLLLAGLIMVVVGGRPKGSSAPAKSASSGSPPPL